MPTIKSKDQTKKVVKKLPEKVVQSKKVIKKLPASEPNDGPATPAKTTVTGWKNRVAEKKKLMQPRVLRPKSELWDKKAEQPLKKRRKGIIVMVKGLHKVGKTNLEISSVDFPGYEGEHRIIPPGKPVYILDTENATEDEAYLHFKEQMEKREILIENCFVENPLTKEIDPTKSMEKLEEWAYSLTEETDGTIGIDNFSDYCEWAYFKLVDKILGIGFTADGKERKHPIPVQYKWMRKHIKSFLKRLRNIGINVILVSQVKAEWAGDGDLDSRKTGKFVMEAMEGSDYWADVICEYYKIKEDGKTVRKLVITDSRFETEDMIGREYIIEGNPTFSGLIDMFKDLL